MKEWHRPEWKDAPIADWMDEGFRYLRDEIQIEETNYRNTLKKRLLETMTLAYWRSVVRHAERNNLVPRKVEDELVEQAIARRMGLHPAQAGRWSKGETFPGADKVFGALVVVLQREIDEVEFPRNREVAWQAACRTLSLIREMDCGLDAREPEREELACVWWLVRHPQSDVLRGRRRAATKQDVYLAVLEALRGLRKAVRSPTDRKELEVRTAADAERALDRWLYPYLLFRVGLLAGWEHLDVEAV